MNAEVLVNLPYDVVAAKLALSLGVGLLIGLEREWAQKEAGVRSFAITALLGTFCAIAGTWTIVVAYATLGLLMLLMNLQSFAKRETLEITTSVSLLVTLTLGVLVGQGHYFTATSGAIVITLLLSFKAGFSAFTGTLQLEEIRAAVLIGLLSFVIYPLMPNRTVDPWHLLNPQQAWAIVVVIAGLGFFNYVMLRLFGARGVYYAAFLGGLVNSTAAAAELSEAFAKFDDEPLPAAALLLTSAAMFVRNLAIVSIFAPISLTSAAPPLGAMALSAVPVVWWGWRNDTLAGKSLTLSSPLSLLRVLRFATIFTAMSCIAALGERYLGNAGFLVLSAVGGLVSSASMTATAAALATNGAIRPEIAAAAAVITSMASAVVTLPVVSRLNRRFRVRGLVMASGLTIAFGLTVLALTNHYVMALLP